MSLKRTSSRTVPDIRPLTVNPGPRIAPLAPDGKKAEDHRKKWKFFPASTTPAHLR